MTIIVSSKEEQQAIINLFEVIKKIHYFVDKDYPIEDVFSETLEIHQIVEEFPNLLNKPIWEI